MLSRPLGPALILLAATSFVAGDVPTFQLERIYRDSRSKPKKGLRELLSIWK